MAASERRDLPDPDSELVRKAGKIFIYAVGALSLLLSCYIMAKGLGLVPGLDFGAGAYFYADIPGFEHYLADKEAAFQNALDPESLSARIPLWGYILLFLLWGFVIWRLWVWIEKKNY